MKNVLIKSLVFIFLLTLFLLPVFTHVRAERSGKPFDQATHQSNDPELMPPSTSDVFEDGMTIEEFLEVNDGPIPNALLGLIDKNINVIVQFEKPSLIQLMNKDYFSRADQQSYIAELESDHSIFIRQITAGRNSYAITQIFSYTKGLNGLMLNIPADMVDELRRIEGVKSVIQPRKYSLQLSSSVPWTRVTEVWQSSTGYKGTGVKVAIIDTGIDYTHKMLGGSGDANDYLNNDPDIVEEGSFPTAKVIGGWDFAGTEYNAKAEPGSPKLIPVPDPDPLDENGHGTHVSSIAAGIKVDANEGVAPEALLYALKVFGKSGSTDLITLAIEWALDPNGDGDLSDHVDVINMSLGSDWGPADTDAPEQQIIEAASSIGIVVVASAGNAGNYSYILGSPSASDSAISVAASNTGGFANSPYVTFTAGGVEQYMPYTKAAMRYTFMSNITTQLIDVETFDPTGELCSLEGLGLAGDELSGAIALIKRASCTNVVQMNNAKSLGAIAALIYNNMPGIFNISTLGGAEPFSAGSLRLGDGERLKRLAPLSVSVGPDIMTKSFNQPGNIAEFSSRGPRGYDSKLKPEITAPGNPVIAARVGGGTTTTSLRGTSMAAPHIAGVAALIKQAHPDWDVYQIKAAMMNTAVDLGDATSVQVPRQGAGRVDAYEAVTTELIAWADPKLISLPWSLIEMAGNYTDTQTITLQNLSNTDVTLDVITKFTSLLSAGATLTPSASTITVPANDIATVDMILNLDAALMPAAFDNELEEHYGYVMFDSGAKIIRLPFYYSPRPFTKLEELDNNTDFDITVGAGWVSLSQSGPLPSDLAASPVAIVSAENPNVLPMGDLRLAGIESAGNDIYASFAMWGSTHVIQPDFNEINLYIYGPSNKNYLNFNFNPTYNGIPADKNQWIVIQVDLDTGIIRRGSPYNIVADFNTGYQLWRLPKSIQEIEDVFSYEVFSYDVYGNEDYGGAAIHNMSKTPFTWSLTKTKPFNEDTILEFDIPDWHAYIENGYQGIMVRDYFGKPGIGQVYYWPLNPDFSGIPAAEDFHLDGLQDISLDFELLASAPNGDALDFEIISGPSHGMLIYEEGDLPELTYASEHGWFGEDSFTFKAVNGRISSDIAMASLTILKHNLPPIAVDDFFVTEFDTELIVVAPGVLENDFDPNPADTLSAHLQNEPKHGILEIEEDGSFIYTPNPNFFGVDSFTYNVIDWPKYGEGGSDYFVSAQVFITVNPYARYYIPIFKR